MVLRTVFLRTGKTEEEQCPFKAFHLKMKCFQGALDRVEFVAIKYLGPIIASKDPAEPQLLCTENLFLIFMPRGRA